MRRLMLATGMLASMASGAMAWPAPETLRAQAFNTVTTAQFAQGGAKEARRCMRRKYGPHYYRGVRRAHRLFMAQACGG
jgi:hypothetical protein